MKDPFNKEIETMKRNQAEFLEMKEIIKLKIHLKSSLTDWTTQCIENRASVLEDSVYELEYTEYNKGKNYRTCAEYTRTLEEH